MIQHDFKHAQLTK